MKKLAVVVLVALGITAVSYFMLWIWWPLGVFSFVFLWVAFILQGLYRVDTVHVAITTFMGERQTYWDEEDGRDVQKTDFMKEGWHFLPFQSAIFGAVPLSVEAVNEELKVDKVRTPDMAELAFNIGLTFEPWPEFLVNYENKGKAKQVQKILGDVVGGAIREKSISRNEDPQTWQQAIEMPRSFLRNVVEKILSSHETFTDEDLDELVEQLQDGGAELPIEDLGIILRRLNVLSIAPQGELYKDAEKFAREAAQKQAEKAELKHVRESIDDFKGTGLNAQEAARVIQTERGKITHSVSENRWSISPEMAAVVTPIVEAVGKIGKNDSTANAIENGLKAIAESLRKDGK